MKSITDAAELICLSGYLFHLISHKCDCTHAWLGYSDACLSSHLRERKKERVGTVVCLGQVDYGKPFSGGKFSGVSLKSGRLVPWLLRTGFTVQLR